MLRVIFSFLLVQIVAGASGPCVAMASSSAAPVLNFSLWKKQQITDAQNRAVRVFNRMQVIRSTTGNLNEIIKLESEFKGAEQYVEVVKDLTIEDYFNVYLVHFSDNQKVLIEAAKTMSKEEVAELLRLLLRNRTESAALNETPISTIGEIAHSKAPTRAL